MLRVRQKTTIAHVPTDDQCCACTRDKAADEPARSAGHSRRSVGELIKSSDRILPVAAV